MKMLFYEMKKTILRKYMLVLVLAAVALNTLLIYIQYCQAGIGFSEEITEKSATEGEWKYYEKLHEQLDGTVTAEKVEYVTGALAKYKPLISSRMYSMEYDPENTETGYFWGDYSVLQSYFYDKLEYLVKYRSLNDELVEQAQENIAFYEEKGNRYEVGKNQYIVSHYQNRQLNAFYDFQGWEKLFAYDISDLFVFALFLIAIVPCYYQERKDKMTDILLVSRKWRWGYVGNKRLSLCLWAVFLTVLFAAVDSLAVHVLYGLPGAGVKLYTLSDYQYTPFNGSLIGFFLYIQVMKCLCLIFFTEIGILVSRRIGSVYLIYLFLILALAVGVYCSGFVGSNSPLKQYLTLLNPLSAVNLTELYKNCYGISVFGSYVPWVLAFLFVQVCIGFLLRMIFRPSAVCGKDRFRRMKTDGRRCTHDSDGME